MTSKKARELFRRWRRRSTRLLETLGPLQQRCRTDGAPEPVHELRVSLRRLRLLLRLGAAGPGKHAVVEFRHWSRAVSDALSQLRDLDVTLEWLDGRPASARIIATLERRRRRCWDTCSRTLPKPARNLERRLTRWKVRRKTSARLARLYYRFVQVHEVELARAAPRLFDLPPTERHAFRRRLRRLRYLRELALSRHRQGADRLLKQLVGLQEALGEYQNRRVVQVTLRQFKSPLPLRRALARESRSWEDAARRQLRALRQARGWETLTVAE
ncbi:MAG: CHAD domain-containing protein [Verrucomicrobia bacterium]|nr:CHAD domain-containing protein [Verrucomicrobiota bacterium]